MAFTIDTTPGRLALTFEGSVTVRDARELAAALVERLEEGAVVDVGTTGLEDMDSCILQLLCALRKAVPALSFEAPSSQFLGFVDRCGLRRELLNGRGPS